MKKIYTIPITLLRWVKGADGSVLATSDNQSALNSLIETLQELISRLDTLCGAMNSGAPALRVMLLTGSTTAVTGSLTSAGTITTMATLTNFGTGYPAYIVAMAQSNLAATLANIQNVVSG